MLLIVADPACAALAQTRLLRADVAELGLVGDSPVWACVELVSFLFTVMAIKVLPGLPFLFLLLEGVTVSLLVVVVALLVHVEVALLILTPLPAFIVLILVPWFTVALAAAGPRLGPGPSL